MLSLTSDRSRPVAGRPTFTVAQKASAYIALLGNDGNVLRTSRETGVPEPTLRRWKNGWEKNGAPDVSDPVVAQALDDYAAEAILVRDFALITLKGKIPDAKPGELITIIGVLDDKITRARGLATSRTEHVHKLPSREDLLALVGAGIRQIAESTVVREEEIIEGQIVEQAPRRALPTG
jgi:hypothetical protein